MTGIKLRKTEIISHDNPEQGMSRNGGKSTHHPNGVTTRKDIKEILDAGKTKRNIDCIDNPVEPFIEIPVVPEEEVKCKEFQSLLGQSGNNKGSVGGIDTPSRFSEGIVRSFSMNITGNTINIPASRALKEYERGSFSYLSLL